MLEQCVNTFGYVRREPANTRYRIGSVRRRNTVILPERPPLCMPVATDGGDEEDGLGIGIGVGLAIGASIGLLTDNLALWLPMGFVIGLTIGGMLNW